MLAEGSGHARFAVKFYVTAMLFILFDIEVIFLVPWVLVFREFLAVKLADFIADFLLPLCDGPWTFLRVEERVRLSGISKLVTLGWFAVFPFCCLVCASGFRPCCYLFCYLFKPFDNRRSRFTI